MALAETKEGAALALPPPDHEEAQRVARDALATEWRAANPRTADDVAAFYATAQGIVGDLEAWHAHPMRREWTAMLVHVARQGGAARIVDIGCGAGHDLLALKEACPDAELFGVEPNEPARRHLVAAGIPCAAYVHDAPVETADLLICIDVLEHVPDPEGYLADIARHARIGCLLFETVGSFDITTPLHLRENIGWHPGRVLERCGWEQVDRTPDGRVRVWRRMAETGRRRAGLLLCAYRSVSAETLAAILALCAGGGAIGWRLRQKNGDALISRSRSIIVTKWWQETDDDVFLMLDDDVVFSPQDAERLAGLCRAGYDIVCGAYPTHDGGHLACRTLPGVTTIDFGPGTDPIEIQCAATGFMAVHRRVIDAMVGTMPLCHGKETWAFYPLFQCLVAENEAAGGYEWMSEDYGFSEMARQLGFRVWLDTQTLLRHMGNAAISVRNMAAMHAAIKGV
jgi:SAM-dependent methyltransferase